VMHCVPPRFAVPSENGCPPRSCSWSAVASQLKEGVVDLDVAADAEDEKTRANTAPAPTTPVTANRATHRLIFDI
jgi:hypothetical protein